MANRGGTNKSNKGSSHKFSEIPRAEIQRSQLDRSFGIKTAFFEGDLVPIFCDEALPGDTLNLKLTVFARIATLLNPIMDNVYLDFFFFAVPNRLLWDNWEKFNGAQDNPGDSTSFLMPTSDSSAGYNIGTLQDFIGLPPLVANIVHQTLPLRAYNKIWNEWFRSEDLQDSLTVDTGDGPDNIANYVLKKRGKRHDYFTSCLPFPQKGPSVALPLGISAPLVGVLDIDGNGTPSWDGQGLTDSHLTSDANTAEMHFAGNADASPGLMTWNDPALDVDLSAGIADLTAATAATINDIREAFQIQRLHERDARGGTRYTEVIKSHFGVTSDDARLQRSEFLGGGSTPVLLKPVHVTTTVGLGSLGAYGIAAEGGIGFTKSFTEHCTLIGLVAARADLNYQQGLDRQFSRSTRFDFYWPALSHLGEQAVLNQEIDAQGTGGGAWDTTTFGFQERYAEYRYKNNMVTGLMRSVAPATLDVWHLAQEFASPVLNATFIEENAPMNRVLAVPGEANFIFDGYFKYKCARPMPTYSVPGMIDHF